MLTTAFIYTILQVNMPDRNVTLRPRNYDIRFVKKGGTFPVSIQGEAPEGKRIKAMTAVLETAQYHEDKSARLLQRRARKISRAEFDDSKIEIIGGSNQKGSEKVMIQVTPNN